MTKLSDKILSTVLGSTPAAAAPCVGADFIQSACWVRNKIPTEFHRTCYHDRCDRRTYCGSWRAVACRSSC